MTFAPEQIDALKAPLSQSAVKHRAQAGRQLSYIEGWHAIAEANRIFGFDGWDRETIELTLLGEPRLVDGKWRVGYRAKVRITVYPRVVREGYGFGSGIDKDPDQAHESALKEAETDAMKRALMTFGNPFGLALYDKEQRNVAAAAPDRSIARAYVVGAKIDILNAETASELDGWWVSEKERRRAADVIPGASEYEELAAAFKDRKHELVRVAA